MRSRSVLLVEDNPNDEMLTLRAFKKNQIANRIVVVRDGVEALEYLFGTGRHAGRDLNDVPALVLLDLNLPKIGGLEVLRQLRSDSRTQLLPVIILTSSVEESDLISGYSLGANSYIRKPVDFVNFTDAVARLGNYWLTLNEPPPHPFVVPPS
jgi:two-component system response regulator